MPFGVHTLTFTLLIYMKFYFSWHLHAFLELVCHSSVYLLVVDISFHHVSILQKSSCIIFSQKELICLSEYSVDQKCFYQNSEVWLLCHCRYLYYKAQSIEVDWHIPFLCLGSICHCFQLRNKKILKLDLSNVWFGIKNEPDVPSNPNNGLGHEHDVVCVNYS